MINKNTLFREKDNLLFIFLIFIFFYLFLILTVKIPLNYGGDEKIYIRNLINIFSNNTFFEGAYFYFRWGMYLIPSIFYFFFESNPLTFFLSSAIPIFLSFLVYFFILNKIIVSKKNLFFISIFLFWLTNPFIINSTFNLVTEGQGIFVLSLVLFLFLKINFNNEKSILNIFLLVLLSFYLYGIKEINTFIILPILIITFFNIDQKGKFIIFILGILLLIIESYFIWKFSNGEIFSKFHYFFLSDKSVFVNRFWWNDPKFFYNDGGIFERWTKIGKISKFYFPVCFLVSIFSIIKLRKNRRLLYLSIIFITYIICITFSFKSLTPLVPYVPVKVENAIITIPLGIIILIDFLFTIKINKNLRFLYLFILFSFFIRQINFIDKLLIPEIKKTDHNILTVYKKFNSLDDFYYKTDCLFFSKKVFEEIFVLFSKYKDTKVINGKVIYFYNKKKELTCKKENIKKIYKLTVINN